MAITLSTSWQKVAEKYLGNSAGNVYIRLYAKYSSQDVVNNKTKSIQQQLRVYYDGSWINCGVWDFTGYGNYYSSSQAVNPQGDIVQGSYSGASYTFNTGETTIATSAGIDVSHGADGTKSIQMGCWGSFTSWGWEGSSGSVTVNLPTIDRAAPTITQSQTIDSATSITVSGTSDVDCSEWGYQLDGGSWVYWTGSARSASNTITVTEGTHTIQIAGKKSTNNIWGYGTSATLDTKRPVINFTISNVGTNSLSLDVTTDSNCENWAYSIDRGGTWTTFTSQEQRHATVTISGLTVNTQYPIQVRAKRIINGIFGYSDITNAKTQGGIVHIKIGSTWKDALAYVKVGNAWKQAIVYTKVGSNWRIGT